MAWTMTIDGERLEGEGAQPVLNPATGAAFAECPVCSPEQLERAMDSAAKAFVSWREDEAARRQALLACADALQGHAGEIARTLTQEQGKPLEAATQEVIGAAVWFRVTAGLSLEGETIQDDDERRIELRRKPLGVVGGITPWNFPIVLAVWKIAPALLAGNTMVLKPSPFTPLSTLQMGDVLREVLPPGVLNVVSGGDELGRWITEHPTPRKISFTGSVATGKKILASVAPDLKRVTLELGGNDPAIVLGDADPERIAEKLFWGAFGNCGQICVAAKRVYVDESLYPTITEKLAALAKEVSVGDGLEDGVRLGPINNRPQFERVQELVEDARKEGATFLAGGEPLAGDGYFFAPTIVTDLSDGSRLVDEEQFGPALPIMPFRDVEEAIERANRTHFGLGGSVWTSDLERGAELAGRLECGTGWVNQHAALTPVAPFGGVKWSGMGYENGRWGLSSFSELQVIDVAKG